MSSNVPTGTAGPAYRETTRVIEEVLAGEGLSIGQAARSLPSGRGRAGKVSPATIWRWCVHGARSKSGRRVVLESVRTGCRLTTTRAALGRFFGALDDRARPEEAVAAPPAALSPHAARRAREVTSTREQLRARGMG
jgi:hypothetical protein